MSEPVNHLGRMMLIWNWIEAWLHTVVPESLVHLYPRATEQQVQAVETALGFPLPEDLKASWTLHNENHAKESALLWLWCGCNASAFHE